LLFPCFSSKDKRWDALTDPCDLYVEPYEQVNIWDLAQKGDIKVLNKVLLVFGSLCKEIAFLQKESEKFVHAFLAYGLFDEADEGLVQIQMGKMLPMLTDMEKFVVRCFTVLHNVVVQLGSLYNAQSELYRTTFRFVHLQRYFCPAKRGFF
jgi:WASH complex subunit 7